LAVVAINIVKSAIQFSPFMKCGCSSV